MKVDPRNLQIKLFRGRSQLIATRIGSFAPNVPPPAGRQSFAFAPGDITNWWFVFTIRSNYILQQPNIALTYDPISNLADPSQGQLLFNILDTDTEMLDPGNYVFDIMVTLWDWQPRFFCGGTVSVSDSVTESTLQ
jgi:hypothetical protein